MLMMSLGSTVLFTLMLLLSNSLLIVYIIGFLNGIATSVRVACSYMSAMEYAPEKKKKTVNMIGAISDSFTIIGIALYFYFVKDGESALYLHIIISAALMAMVYNIPDTPSFLYSKKKWKELHHCFGQISKINKSQPLNMKFDKEDLIEDEEQDQSGSVKSLMCDDKTRLVNLIVMIFNWSV